VNILVKIGLTAMIFIAAIPGLIIEPGPFSEIIAALMISSIWGFDFEAPGGS